MSVNAQVLYLYYDKYLHSICRYAFCLYMLTSEEETVNVSVQKACFVLFYYDEDKIIFFCHNTFILCQSLYSRYNV